MKAILLGGSNSIIGGALRSGLSSQMNLLNLAIGASSSLQNLSRVIEYSDDIIASDIVFTESNVNDSHNANILDVDNQLIIDNIVSYYHELSLRTNRCVVFILPVRCIKGKTEDKSIVELINNCHRACAIKYGFKIVDIATKFNNLPLDWERLLLPDPRHVNNAFMYNLGCNVAKHILENEPFFHAEYKDFFPNVESSNFKLLKAIDLGNVKEKSNNMFSETTYELDRIQPLEKVKNFETYSIIGLGTWSDGPSSLKIKTKDATFTKNFNSLNAFNEICNKLVIDSDTIFSSKFGDCECTENSVNVPSKVRSQSGVLLTCLLFMKSNNKRNYLLKKVTSGDLDNNDLSFLIPDAEPYYRSISFFIRKTPMSFFIETKHDAYKGSTEEFYSNYIKDTAIYFARIESTVTYKLMRLARWVNPHNKFAVNYLNKNKNKNRT